MQAVYKLAKRWDFPRTLAKDGTMRFPARRALAAIAARRERHAKMMRLGRGLEVYSAMSEAALERAIDRGW